MKAYSLWGVNDLRYGEVDIPKIPTGWALLKIKACGICSSDIPRIFSTGTYHFPTIPGHEISGVVIDVACAMHSSWIGKRVGVFPLLPCMQCESCLRGEYETCSDYNYLGSRCNGGFAEFVAVPVWNLIELPDNVPFENAAMLEPLSVALHAVKKLEIKNNDRVAIVGTGMIGLAAAQWAVACGAKKVDVVGRSDAKRLISEALEGISYVLKNEITTGSYDAVLEAVGSKDSITLSLDLSIPNGSIVLLGNPSSDICLSQAEYWNILRRQLRISGTWNSSYECGEDCDWTQAMNALASGKLNVSALITHRVSCENVSEALRLMRIKREPYCKVMTLWD